MKLSKRLCKSALKVKLNIYAYFSSLDQNSMFILRVFSCMLIYSEHVHKWGKESHTIQQNEHK